MIPTNELRIGNWVFDEDNAYAKIEAVRSNRFVNWNGVDDESTNISLPSDNAMYGGNINPVPLTPEILEKCGFVKINGNAWEYNGSALCCYWDGVEFCFKCGIDANLCFAATQYVHQLQNLIFFCTGTELNITL